MKDNSNSTNNGAGILVVVAMVMGVLIGLMFGQHNDRHSSDTLLQSKVSEVMDLVETQYVESIDEDTLSERLLAAMLSELDPHSAYMSKRETQRIDEQMRGKFDGVGLVLHREGDTTFVGSVMDGGPSEGRGLLPGDLILVVDGDTICGPGTTADTAISHLRGRRGTTAHVTLLRGPEREELHIKIPRGAVPTPSLSYSGMIDAHTGYILLSSFTTTSHDEFCAALRELKRQGMKRLVIDLRGNGGGSLQAATDIAGEFLEAGQLIVYTQGAHSRRHNTYARHGGLMTEGDVVVMLDEFSASASEVLSGALQDNQRATIMGRRSFGKGLVQKEFSLSDGSSVMLTTARYYTPSGRCIQRPYTEGSDEYYRSFMERVVNDAGGDSSAYDGGIIPDITLNYMKDSTLVYYNQLANQGLINRTAFNYVRRHAADLLKRYEDAETFKKGFHVSNDLVEQLVAAGVKAGIPRNDAGLRAQRPWITTLLKANIASFLYGNDGFYKVYLPEDNDLQQVMEKWK